jgi:hypothetical protein
MEPAGGAIPKGDPFPDLRHLALNAARVRRPRATGATDRQRRPDGLTT